MDGFVNDIQIGDYSWGASRAVGASKAATKDFTVKKNVDRSSTALLQNLYSGRAIPDGSLVTRKAGEQPFVFLRFCFTNLRVTAVDLSGPGDEGPQETVSFSFGSIVEKYTQQANDGSAGSSFTFGWDLLRNLQLGSSTQNSCGASNPGP